MSGATVRRDTVALFFRLAGYGTSGECEDSNDLASRKGEQETASNAER